MVASAALAHGTHVVTPHADGLRAWMTDLEYESVEHSKGV